MNLRPEHLPLKLEATMLEREMIKALNGVQAWRDSLPGTPFPEELDTTVRALLMTYELRRIP